MREGLFRCIARRLAVVEQAVDIQVDAQFSHLAIVVGIEDMLLKFVLLDDITL